MTEAQRKQQNILIAKVLWGAEDYVTSIDRLDDGTVILNGTIHVRWCVTCQQIETLGQALEPLTLEIAA